MGSNRCTTQRVCHQAFRGPIHYKDPLGGFVCPPGFPFKDDKFSNQHGQATGFLIHHTSCFYIQSCFFVAFFGVRKPMLSILLVCSIQCVFLINTSNQSLRWTRYFYTTTLPSLKGTGWNQVKTSLEDHCDPSAHPRGQTPDTGRSFNSVDTPLPPSIRKRIVDMKLKSVKKAGTLSNQRAASATAFALHNVASSFRGTMMAWSGGSNESNNS